MSFRTFVTAFGSAVTTFLLVTVAIIELLDFEFSAIVAIPVGLLAAVVVLIGLLSGLEDASLGLRRATSAYAGFGLTVLVLLGLWYVNVGGELLTTDLIVLAGLLVAVVVYVALHLQDL